MLSSGHVSFISFEPDSDSASAKSQASSAAATASHPMATRLQNRSLGAPPAWRDVQECSLSLAVPPNYSASPIDCAFDSQRPTPTRPPSGSMEMWYHKDLSTRTTSHCMFRPPDRLRRRSTRRPSPIICTPVSKSGGHLLRGSVSTPNAVPPFPK
ncbi:hypothetical protein K432DRAFT_133116 [Lepidopterella palustris CBS 459.81]|uniref:Uncharacterized protein n=1 Tax=Lepidopterella palustris CBS 459.81 TaxID=1314670 RepID=A0A8E2JC17_9PEZI|nr:hypothetical protein K432DRAFT_133116 [Lepidopterella palustris CBS 459.81]